MKTNHRCWSLGCLILLAGCATAQGDDEGLNNAASASYGVRVSIEAGPGVAQDKGTAPEALIDGNPHTRCVMTGAPYTITLVLPFKIHVEKLSLTQTDYAEETAPKELRITFDDGTDTEKTLEPPRPRKVKRTSQIVWQDVAVGREIKSLKITVLSNYEGAVKWGGLGDIAIWTKVNPRDRFRIPGYDGGTPAFMHATNAVADSTASPVPVHLPPVALAGEHPCILFTPRELKQFAAELPTSERGKAALDGFLKMAETYAGMTPRFPSVAGTTAEMAGKEHSSLSHRTQALGFAYGLTGDLKYARAAREILLGYARVYGGYPRHSGRNKSDSSKVTFQRLSEAMWLIPQLEGYDYIYNAGVLTDEDKKAIETGLIRPAIFEIRRQEPADEVARRTKKDNQWRTATPDVLQKAQYPNWLNFYSAATIMAGVAVGDENMVDLAVADLKVSLMQGIGADGMWNEGAIGYQLFAMSVMAPAMEAAARHGVDLWSYDHARFKQLFDSPLRYAYPDGTLPGINDSARGKFGSWQTMVYDYAWLRYGDSRYAFLLNHTPRQLHTSEGIYAPTRMYIPVPEPANVAAGSTLFGSLGYAVLRDNDKYALMDYGPHGGPHGHLDKLNLLIFASPADGGGDEMGGEPNFHFYSEPLHNQWTVQSVAHNTMTVDGASQLPNEGTPLIYEASSQLQIMRAQSDKSYPGILLDRTVVVTPDAILDLFAGRGAIEHTWNRTLRFAGKLQGMPAVPPGAQPLGERDGFQHIRVLSSQDATANWRSTWQTMAGPFTVQVAGGAGQRLVLGAGPDAEDMALAQQSGRASDFAMVYSLEGWKNEPRTVKRLSKTGDSVQAIELVQQDGTQTRVFVAHQAGAWQLGDWKSDAQILVTRGTATSLQLALCGGTFAQHGTLELRQPRAGNYGAQTQAGKLELVSRWAP